MATGQQFAPASLHGTARGRARAALHVCDYPADFLDRHSPGALFSRSRYRRQYELGVSLVPAVLASYSMKILYTAFENNNIAISYLHPVARAILWRPQR